MQKFRVLQGVAIDGKQHNEGAEVELDENRADVKSLTANGKLKLADDKATDKKPAAPMTTENSGALTGDKVK